MKREIRQVNYSYKHGDESLPHLKDLVSETPDSEKSKIVAYLKTHLLIGILFNTQTVQAFEMTDDRFR